MIVQRTLAARNFSHAQAGVLLSGLLKLTPFLLVVVPGMISRSMFPGRKTERIYIFVLKLRENFSEQRNKQRVNLIVDRFRWKVPGLRQGYL